MPSLFSLLSVVLVGVDNVVQSARLASLRPPDFDTSYHNRISITANDINSDIGERRRLTDANPYVLESAADKPLSLYNPNRLAIVFDDVCLDETNQCPFDIIGQLQNILPHQCVSATPHCHDEHTRGTALRLVQYLDILEPSSDDYDVSHCLDDVTIDLDHLCIKHIDFEEYSMLQSIDVSSSSSGDVSINDLKVQSDKCVNEKLDTNDFWYRYEMDIIDGTDDGYYSHLDIGGDAPLYGSKSQSITEIIDTNVDIYMLDTGIQANHVDFAPLDRVIQLDETFTQVTDNHGTAAATVAAGYHWGLSRYHTILSYNGCRQYIKSWDAYVCGAAEVGRGVATIVSRITQKPNRAAVINFSLGLMAARKSQREVWSKYVKSLEDCGGIAVSAAGNGFGSDACSNAPSQSDSVITVGGHRRQLYPAHWSSIGKCIDIWAPGTDIPTGVAQLDDLGTTDHKRKKSGTSTATPIVTGIVADWLWVKPDLTLSQIKQLLLDSSVTLYNDEKLTDLCDTELYGPNCQRVQSPVCSNSV